MNIGDNIRKQRIKCDKTQKEVAIDLNVAHQTVSKWETGENEPSVTELKRISKYFNVSIHKLIDSNYSSSNNKNFDNIKLVKLVLLALTSLLLFISLFFDFGVWKNLYINIKLVSSITYLITIVVVIKTIFDLLERNYQFLDITILFFYFIVFLIIYSNDISLATGGILFMSSIVLYGIQVFIDFDNYKEKIIQSFSKLHISKFYLPHILLLVLLILLIATPMYTLERENYYLLSTYRTIDNNIGWGVAKATFCAHIFIPILLSFIVVAFKYPRLSLIPLIYTFYSLIYYSYIVIKDVSQSDLLYYFNYFYALVLILLIVLPFYLFLRIYKNTKNNI